MNIRFSPTSIQVIDNPATDDTAFLWFYSEQIDVGIVVTKKEINQIIKILSEFKKPKKYASEN